MDSDSWILVVVGKKWVMKLMSDFLTSGLLLAGSTFSKYWTTVCVLETP